MDGCSIGWGWGREHSPGRRKDFSCSKESGKHSEFGGPCRLGVRVWFACKETRGDPHNSGEAPRKHFVDLSFLSCSHWPGARIASPVLAPSWGCFPQTLPTAIPSSSLFCNMLESWCCALSLGAILRSAPKPLLTARGWGGAEAEREPQGFECLDRGQER